MLSPAWSRSARWPSSSPGTPTRSFARTRAPPTAWHLPARVRDQVLRKPPAGAKPFHLFHVLDVYRHLESDSVGMAAMESCRISWGKVREVDGASVTVDRQP